MQSLTVRNDILSSFTLLCSLILTASATGASAPFLTNLTNQLYPISDQFQIRSTPQSSTNQSIVNLTSEGLRSPQANSTKRPIEGQPSGIGASSIKFSQTSSSPGPQALTNSNSNVAQREQNTKATPGICADGLLTFELSTGFIYKPATEETLAMMPSTLQLTDCLDFCLNNSSCLAINFEMGLCVLLSSSAKQNPNNLYSSQFPVFTIYAEKKCLLSGDAQASRQKRRCQRAWTFERVTGYEMKTRPKKRLKLATRELCMESCLTEREFECRSANWYNKKGECTLSDQDRHSVSQSEAGDQQVKSSTLHKFYGPANISEPIPVNTLQVPSTNSKPPPGSLLYENYYTNNNILLQINDSSPERNSQFGSGEMRGRLSPVGSTLGGNNSFVGTNSKYRKIRQLFDELELHQRAKLASLIRKDRSEFISDTNDLDNGEAERPNFYLDQHDHSNQEPQVDYLENNCVHEPNKLCEFRKIQNRVLKTVDSIYQDVASVEDCKQKCLNAPYRCYSFDYGDTSERVCRTSHLDQASLLAVKEPYLDVVGAITYELAACFNVSIQCRAREMVAVVSSSKMFKGKIYAKSRPNTCLNDVSESLKFELSMKYQDENCDVKATSNGQQGIFGNDIVIQHHDRIVTTQDVGLTVYCQYDLGNRSITNNVELAIEKIEPPADKKQVPTGGQMSPADSTSSIRQPADGSIASQSALTITGLATTIVRSPNVTMRITNMNGEPVARATVGDRLALLFEIKEKSSPFSIFVREIVAMDGKQIIQNIASANSTKPQNGAGLYHYGSDINGINPVKHQHESLEHLIQTNSANSIEFIDSDGCPTDANIMGPLIRIDQKGHKILAPFDAFKFPTSDLVFFRAVVTSCVSECPSVICSASEPISPDYLATNSTRNLISEGTPSPSYHRATEPSKRPTHTNSETDTNKQTTKASLSRPETYSSSWSSSSLLPESDFGATSTTSFDPQITSDTSRSTLHYLSTSSLAQPETSRPVTLSLNNEPTSSSPNPDNENEISTKTLINHLVRDIQGSSQRNESPNIISTGDSMTTIPGFGTPEPTTTTGSFTTESQSTTQQMLIDLTNNHHGKTPPRPSTNAPTQDNSNNMRPNFSFMTENEKRQVINLFESRIKQQLPSSTMSSLSSNSSLTDIGITPDLTDLYTGFLASLLLKNSANSIGDVDSRYKSQKFDFPKSGDKQLNSMTNLSVQHNEDFSIDQSDLEALLALLASKRNSNRPSQNYGQSDNKSPPSDAAIVDQLMHLLNSRKRNNSQPVGQNNLSPFESNSSLLLDANQLDPLAGFKLDTSAHSQGINKAHLKSHELSTSPAPINDQSVGASASMIKSIRAKQQQKLKELTGENNLRVSQNHLNTQQTTLAPDMQKIKQQVSNVERQRKRDKVANLQALADSYLGAYHTMGKRRRKRSEPGNGEGDISGPGYVYMEQPAPDEGGSVVAIVEMYHTAPHQLDDNERQETFSRVKRQVSQPIYDVDEFVVQSIKIVDRLHFEDQDKGGARGHKKRYIKHKSKLHANHSLNRSSLIASSSQLDASSSPQALNLENNDDLDTETSGRILSWSSGGLLTLVGVALSFVFVQVLLVAIYLFDQSKRRPNLILRQRQARDLIEHHEPNINRSPDTWTGTNVSYESSPYSALESLAWTDMSMIDRRTQWIELNPNETNLRNQADPHQDQKRALSLSDYHYSPQMSHMNPNLGRRNG